MTIVNQRAGAGAAPKTVDDAVALIEKYFPKLFCKSCGIEITEYWGNNGKIISPQRHAAGCEKKFDGIYCLDCIVKGLTNPKEQSNEKPI